MRGLVLAAVGTGALAVAAALASPPLVGLYHDDGIYVGTAISLARGDGYRQPHLPGAPYQSKYPPLYPALLVAVAWLAGDDPETVGAFRWPSVLATLGALALLPGLFRRWGLGERAGWAAAAITGLSPLVLQHALFAMSEAPFLLLTVATLRLLPGPGEAASGRRVAGAAACAAGAILCRTIGVALLPALALAAWRRDRRDPRSWIPLAAGIAAAAAWTLAAGAMRAAEATRGHGPLYDYYLGYGAWVQTSPIVVAEIASANALEVWRGAGDALLGWRELRPGPWVWSPPALVAGALALGGWGRLRRAAPEAATYLGASLALILLWPFDVARFLVPLTPFFVAGGFAAAPPLLGRVRAPAWIGPALAGASALSCLAVVLARFPTASRLPLLDHAIAVEPFANSARWLRENAASGDVVVSDHDPWVWLATRRHAIPPGVFDPLWIYGKKPGEAEWEVAWEESRRLGARWVLATDEWDPNFSGLWKPRVLGDPDTFPPAIRAGPVHVYRITQR
ncbi:MAG: glycosyltransferase family 39 protein [Planctomycetales bacterium]|nr:glycosyltransferase family 39 protein [Planctomycetales bacterium]